VAARLLITPRDVGEVAGRLQAMVAGLGRGPSAAPVVAARYLSPPARERLAAAGIGYADATGNLLLSLERPGLFLRDVGATSDPWRRRGRPSGTLSGPNTARLVRALADFTPPYTVARLAELAGVSVATAYRLAEVLLRDDLIGRAPRAPITRVDWRAIIERWGEDVGTTQAERMTLYLEPRGIPELLTNLRRSRQRYVITGSIGARYFDEAVPPRLAVIYADPVEPLIAELGLRPSPAGNVLVGLPVDDVAFARSQVMGGLQVAAPSQVALDLLGGPGRGPTEAALLLDWMERNPGAWRTQG
jgi:hypothetical protein